MSSPSREHCVACGADTGPGTRRFVGRRRVTDEQGERGFLCPLCASSAPKESAGPIQGRYIIGGKGVLLVEPDDEN